MQKPHERALKIAAVALFGLPALVSGQESDELLARLMSAVTIRCEFGSGVQAGWDEGAPRLEEVSFGEGGQFTFDTIDAEAGKARLMGNVGAADVLVLGTGAGLTFIEQTAAGNLHFTTIFPVTDSPASGRFVAVQSRHWTSITPLPSQFHGTCQILP